MHLFANSQKKQTLKICIALKQVSNCIRPRIKIHLSVLSLLKLHWKNLWHKNITTAKQMPIELHPRQHNEVFYITPENSWFICLTKDAFVTHKTSVRCRYAKTIWSGHRQWQIKDLERVQVTSTNYDKHLSSKGRFTCYCYLCLNTNVQEATWLKYIKYYLVKWWCKLLPAMIERQHN